MILDSSAVLAVLLGEPESARLVRAIAGDSRRLIAAVNTLECAIVLEARKGPHAVRELDLLLHEASIDTVSMDREQVALAREAYKRFGRGRHAARLNLGDCCAYALARQTGELLLFKGGDFSQTDVRAAEY
jgi:ribonuclease VapC